MVARKLLIVSLSIAISGSAFAQSWSLATDWSPPSNPNLTWSYGSGTGSSFTDLVWNSTDLAYESGGSRFIGMNGTGAYADGIAPNQVWLNASFGTADARWTAPATGKYDITLDMGGPLADGGNGNTFAYNSNLTINGVLQSGTFDSTANVMTWTLTNQHLTAGSILDAYVSDPGGAGGGETETVFEINAVPEPAPFAVIGLGILGLLARRRQK